MGKLRVQFFTSLNHHYINSKIYAIFLTTKTHKEYHSCILAISYFPCKGLYMLTTILKTPQAAQVTLGIIQAFTDLCKLSRLLMYLTETTDEKPILKS